LNEDYNKIKLRVKTVEDAVQMLTRMAIRADERMDGFDGSFSNLTVKLEALVDAQIRTEESLARLADSHTRLEEAHTRLAEAQVNLAETQAHTVKRLDALIDIVREDREGRNGK
jgi:hypothetical protein